jgi:hypothetical protein
MTEVVIDCVTQGNQEPRPRNICSPSPDYRKHYELVKVRLEARISVYGYDFRKHYRR